MFTYGDLRILMKLYSMSVIHRKLMFFAQFLLERFMALSFLKETRNSYLEMLQDWLFPQVNED